MESLEQQLARANEAIIMLGETLDQMVDNCILMETQIKLLEGILASKGVLDDADMTFYSQTLSEVRGQLKNEKKKDS